MIPDEIYFLTRYIPFWAIPLFLIAGEFGYLFWMRKKKKLVAFCLTLSLIGLICTVFYYIAGGPEKSVRILMNLSWYFS